MFELSHLNGIWTEKVLYSFAGGTHGADPVNGLIMDAAGNLYGTTYYGDKNGTVFELSASGGNWTGQVISPVNTTYAGLTMDVKGNIFGVTDDPSAFELSPNGDGSWTPTVIYSFAGSNNGYYEEGTPVLDTSGNLYGTTTIGGIKNYGTVYKLVPGKDGKWTEKILHSFKGDRDDGSEPWAGIVFDDAGNIYGTTVSGGKYGDGTVFELIAEAGKDNYKERILWDFGGSDGSQPYGSLILDSKGNLYGTTKYGGSSNSGVVFKVKP